MYTANAMVTIAAIEKMRVGTTHFLSLVLALLLLLVAVDSDDEVVVETAAAVIDGGGLGTKPAT
jgi:hypothetical protein